MVQKAQRDAEVALTDREAISAIERVLTSAGVEFLNDGAPGVRLRKVAVITGREILQARLLVRWSLQQLARAARLPLNTVMRAELLDRQAIGIVVHATAIREALEAAGIEFIGGTIIQMRKVQP